MQGNLWNLLIHVVEENGKDVQYFGNPDGSGVFLDVLLYALIGFVITFLGVAILIVLVWVVGKIIKAITGKLDGRKKPSSEAEPPAAVQADGISEEIRAAIVAAISAYYLSEDGNCEFKVKRIKRL